MKKIFNDLKLFLRRNNASNNLLFKKEKDFYILRKKV